VGGGWEETGGGGEERRGTEDSRNGGRRGRRGDRGRLVKVNNRGKKERQIDKWKQKEMGQRRKGEAYSPFRGRVSEGKKISPGPGGSCSPKG